MSMKAKDPWVRIINVTDHVIHKKGYTLYKVISKVFPKNSVEAVSEVIVWKRYSEFKKLHKALFALHQGLYLKDTFPLFAKTRFFGRFDEAVIEERRLCALNLLQFAADHSPLFTSQVFVKFFEVSNALDEPEVVTPVEENFPITEILQPIRDNKSPEIQRHSPLNSDDSSLELKPIPSLGGTWQHHQVPDRISLGSHHTEDDDDDRTTFTDDESSTSRLSLSLAEFDPLCPSEMNEATSDQKELCNAWLLSALQFCNNPNPEKDIENSFEFPKPFVDVESDGVEKCDSGDDIPALPNVPSSEFDEFDPLVSREKDTSDDQSKQSDPEVTASSGKENIPQASYRATATQLGSSARAAEVEGNYAQAFDLYKKAIEMLLQGSQNESCKETRNSVRKTVLFYLMQAEAIYENKLWTNREPKNEANVFTNSYTVQRKALSFRGSEPDLKNYKVLGILNKVLLVSDATTDAIYVVKTLYKSPSPQHPDAYNTLPAGINYVVKLIQVYETNYAIFLILEYASGGRLLDYVHSYQQHSPVSTCPDGTFLYTESKILSGQFNVYSGKKVLKRTLTGSTKSSTEFIRSVLDSELVTSKNCTLKFVALTEKNEPTVGKEEVVAKFNVPAELSHTSNDDDDDEVTDRNKNEIKRIKESDNKKPQMRITRNRLSSTGSLETALSQKAGIFEAFHAMDDALMQATSKVVHLPESCTCLWAAEIVVGLESLHRQGVIWMDFNPDNVMLGSQGHILLTYQSQWNCVDHLINDCAKENLYCAPEVGGIFPVTTD